MILRTTQGTLAFAARPADSMSPYGVAWPRSDSFSGQSVTPESAQGLTAFYGGVEMIGNSVSLMPLETIDTKAKSGQRVVAGSRVAVMLRYQPNEDQTAPDLWGMVARHLLLRGNAYLAKLRDAAGNVVELYPLMPQFVTPWRDANGRKVYRVRIYNDTVTFTEADYTDDAILHIKGPSTSSAIVGASPVEVARHRLGVHLAQSEYQGRAYQDGMLIKGALSTPETNLSPDAAARIKAQWRSAYSGVGNSHEIAVLHSGVTFQQVSLSPEDAQFIQTMKWAHTEAATMLSIPASRLNGDTGSGMRYANMTQDDQAYLTMAVQPRTTLIEAAVNLDKDLFGAFSQWVPKFNHDAVTRADIKTRFDVYRVEREIGTRSQNDILRAEDRQEIGPEGDDYTPLKSSGTRVGGGPVGDSSV